jgi:hypothetical protein
MPHETPDDQPSIDGTRLTRDRYLQAWDADLDALAEAAGDLAREVPSCPGWTVRDPRRARGRRLPAQDRRARDRCRAAAARRRVGRSRGRRRPGGRPAQHLCRPARAARRAAGPGHHVVVVAGPIRQWASGCGGWRRRPRCTAGDAEAAAYGVDGAGRGRRRPGDRRRRRAPRLARVGVAGGATGRRGPAGAGLDARPRLGGDARPHAGAGRRWHGRRRGRDAGGSALGPRAAPLGPPRRRHRDHGATSTRCAC